MKKQINYAIEVDGQAVGGIGVFDVVRIFAEPYEYNAGSRGVLEKAGFTYEGIMRNEVYKNGEIHSYCMYSLLREDIL